MQDFLKLLFVSGQKGFELAFFVLMPIMVFMLSMMRVLDHIGVLRRIAIICAPVLLLFGIPGLGVFAILQILLVSFAAPVSTFRIMDQDTRISDRKIASGFAAILCMSQANATVPLSTFGLNLPVTMATSLVGGLFAAWMTYHFWARHLPDGVEKPAAEEILPVTEKKNLIALIIAGGEEGLQLTLKALPLLVLAVLLVSILKSVGVIDVMQKLCGPILAWVGISAAAVLPFITKYIAGGTAMMGATVPLMQDGSMSAVDLNKIAGWTTNALDPVGLAVLVSAGKRFAAFALPAIKGALMGIVLRGILHLLIF